jgi:hypothetical protein
MTATIIRLYGAVSGASPHTAAAAKPQPLRRPSIRQSDDTLVGSQSPYRAPVISLPLGRRLSFRAFVWSLAIPFMGAMGLAIWVSPFAFAFGWHPWMVLPSMFGAMYGAVMRGCFA